MIRGIIICLAIFAGLCLVVGIPTWISGCRENSESQCLLPKVHDLTLTTKYYGDTNCTICTKRCRSGKTTRCCETAEIVCVKWVLMFSNATADDICIFKHDNDEFYNKYQLNSTYHVIIDQEGQCSLDFTFYENVWITGIFFLSLTGLLLAIIIALVIVRRIDP